MTARRDVTKLVAQGLVRVVSDGVSVVTDLLMPVEFRFRSHEHTAAKRAIARYALFLLEESSAVGFDSGTTVLEVARRLPKDRSLTVVTHSLPVMDAVARYPGVHLIGLGGVFLPQGQAFTGNLALRSVSQLRIQTFLLGATSIRGGSMWATNGFGAEMKRALMQAAERTVLLADSSKFDYSALMMVAELSKVSIIVTDDLVSDATRAAIANAGVELVAVSSGDEAAEERDERGQESEMGMSKLQVGLVGAGPWANLIRTEALEGRPYV
jgi:DeoR/GlpR family transcriptional regulator of sugar metabolism